MTPRKMVFHFFSFFRVVSLWACRVLELWEKEKWPSQPKCVRTDGRPCVFKTSDDRSVKWTQQQQQQQQTTPLFAIHSQKKALLPVLCAVSLYSLSDCCSVAVSLRCCSERSERYGTQQQTAGYTIQSDDDLIRKKFKVYIRML